MISGCKRCVGRGSGLKTASLPKQALMSILAAIAIKKGCICLTSGCFFTSTASHKHLHRPLRPHTALSDFALNERPGPVGPRPCLRSPWEGTPSPWGIAPPSTQELIGQLEPLGICSGDHLTLVARSRGLSLRLFKTPLTDYIIIST